MIRKIILKHRFLISGIISVIAALVILALCNGQEFSRYGLQDYKAGLQRVFNICKADPNITVVCYYKMEGAGPSIPDLSGNGHNLTKHGSPTYQQPDYLNLNRAILFTPGTSDYFDCADHDDFDLNVGATSYDCVIWLIVKTSDSGNITRLIQKKGAATKYYDITKDASDKLWVKIKDTSTTTTYTSSTSINSGSYILLEIKIDRDSATGLAGFINGSEDGTAQDMSGIGSIENDYAINFGSDYTGASFWDGGKAEILIIKGAPLPAWVMSTDFAQMAYKVSMGWPSSVPREAH